MVLSNDEIEHNYLHWLGKYRDHKAGRTPPSLESGHWREFYRKNAVKYGNLYKKRTGSVLQGFNEVRL
jgi:hypothetical protein